EIPIGDARLGLERPDVHAAYPGIAGSEWAGFRFPLAPHLKAGSNGITLKIEAGDGTRTEWSMGFVRLGWESPSAPHHFRAGIDGPIRSGFPFEVTQLLRVFRPGVYDGESCWSDDLMARAVEDLEAVWHSGPRAPALGRYVRFLKTMSHRFRLVNSGFPRFN